jgi:hypothetical protein
VGAGAGVGAGADPEPRLPGPGAAGSGGIAELERAAVCLAFGVCVWLDDDPEDSLCPGADAAAIPAKMPLKAAETVSTPAVSARVRAASASRAAVRRLIPCASLTWQVEHRSMNGL